MNKTGFIMFSLVGLSSALAHLLRYIALDIGLASVVTPLFSIAPIFHIFLAYLLNRKLEVFSKAVILGTFAVVVGTILIV